MALVATIVALLLSAVLTITPASAATTPNVVAAAPSTAPGSALATALRFDPTSGSSTQPTVNACGNGNANAVSYQYPLLPLDRWSGDTNSFHNRYGSNALSSIAERVSMQGVTSLMFSIGNALWGITSGLTNFSIEFCLLDRMGGLADNAAATIGNAILGNALLGAIVVAILVSLLVRAFRTGENPMKSLLTKGMIVGLMAVMMVGATASTGGGSKNNPDGPFVPGTFGPGWVAMTLNKTIQNVTAGPSAAMLGTTGQPTPLTINSGSLAAGGKSTNWMSCDAYVTSLRTAYTNRISAGSMDLSGSTPMILSSMWEETGLRSWRTAQFGQGSIANSKTLDDKVWCRMLEMNADIPGMTNINGSQADNATAGTQRGIASSVPGWLDWSDKNDFAKDRWMSSAVRTSNDEQMDRSMIAWLACDPAENFASDPARPGANASDWSIRAEFTEAGNSSVGDKHITPEQCVQWWAKANDPMNNKGLDWGGGSGEVAERMPNNPATASFLNALHGQNVGGAVVSGIAYIISAFCILIVFGILSIAVIFSKLGMVVILVIVPFLFVAELLPFGNKQGSKLMEALKYFIGMAFFAAMTGLLMSVMVVITKLLIDGGMSLASSGGEIMGLLWSGAAPLLAAILVNMIFKKIFKAPSMFKPSSAMSWAGAAGAIGGGAVGGMVGGRMVQSAMSQASRRATDGVLGKVGLGPRAGMGGKKVERQGANPIDAPATTDETRKSTDGLESAIGGPREGDVGASLSRREKAAALGGAAGDSLDSMGRGIAGGLGSAKDALGGTYADGQSRKLAKLNSALGEDEKPVESLTRRQRAISGLGGVTGAGFVAAKSYAGLHLSGARSAIAAGAMAAKANPAQLAKKLGAGALGATGKVAKTSMLVGAAAVGTAVAPGIAVPLIAGSLIRKNQQHRAAKREPGQLSARQGAYERYDSQVKQPMLEQMRQSQAGLASGTGEHDPAKAEMLNRQIKKVETGRASVPTRRADREAMLNPNDTQARAFSGQLKHEDKKAAAKVAYDAPRNTRLTGAAPGVPPAQVEAPPVAVPTAAPE